IRRLRTAIGVASYRSYGMTECPMLSSGRADDPEEKCVGTDGRVVPGARCRVVGDDGADLPAGSEGEIFVFGTQMCVGYVDRALGERVCACVVARVPGEAPTLEDVARFMIARGVMPQKIPEQLEIVAALPRNATGKVKKHELRARFAATRS